MLRAGATCFKVNKVGQTEEADIRVTAASADLAITADDGTDMTPLGLPLSYTITASNPGPCDAPGALVVDTFPSALMNVALTCGILGTLLRNPRDESHREQTGGIIVA